MNRLLVVHLTRAWETFHRRPMLEALLEAAPDLHCVLVDRPVTFDATLLRSPGKFLAGVGRTSWRPLSARVGVARPWMLLHEVVAERLGPVPRVNGALVRPQLARTVRRAFPEARSIVEWVYHPRQSWTLGAFGRAGLVYECYDEYALTPRGARARFDTAAERRLLARADVTFATSEALRASRGGDARRIAPLSNGVPDAFFDASPDVPDPIDAIPHPRIGCHGTVRSLLAFEMLEALFRKRGDWHLVFVGPVHRSARLGGLSALPNVHLLGPRPQGALAGVVRRFDVGIVPMEENEFTRASSPMRLFEYAACGVPIVATPLPENRRLEPEARIVPARPDAFEQAIEAALAEPRERLGARLRARAEEVRWSRVVRRDVLPVLDEVFPR